MVCLNAVATILIFFYGDAWGPGNCHDVPCQNIMSLEERSAAVVDVLPDCHYVCASGATTAQDFQGLRRWKGGEGGGGVNYVPV